MKKLIIKDDGILAAWSRRTESSKGTTDAWIKFYLPDEALLDAILARYNEDDFRGACKTGGAIIEITLHEYDDLEHTPPQFEETKPAIKVSNIAALICQDPLFPDYCKNFLDDYLQNMKKEKIFVGNPGDFKDIEQILNENMARVIRYICSIKSRAELDTNENARHLFSTVIDKPFNAYKQQRK